MLHACVQRFDVTGTIEIFLELQLILHVCSMYAYQLDYILLFDN